ncbi:MAG TPA: PEGA domain-containing protein [Ignavibacteriaceae bacterium]|nr:PEGA domain-containing protein [Ignavibacteriaceae bacterium]
MKKLIFLLIIPLMMLITSCDSDDPFTPTPTGKIYLTSSPADAEIWIDGSNTFKTTPDTINDVDQGTRSITLKLQDYRDTTFTVSVTGGQTSVVGPVVLVSNIMITLYGPVKIYETSGTSTSQPSGLDLSTGLAHGVSSPEANLVDIYYSSAGYLVQSADLYGTLIRETDFFVSSGTNLFDEVDSPLRTIGTWTTGIGDRENNYVFLYDHDGHYSKLKIVNWGGGNPGDPSWVEVQWYYNTALQDNRF